MYIEVRSQIVLIYNTLALQEGEKSELEAELDLLSNGGSKRSAEIYDNYKLAQVIEICSIYRIMNLLHYETGLNWFIFLFELNIWKIFPNTFLTLSSMGDFTDQNQKCSVI